MRQLALYVLFVISISANAADSPVAISYTPVGGVPNATMDSVKNTLNKYTTQVLDKYQIDNMPSVTVKIWQNRKDFEATYGEDAKYVQGYVVHDLWEIRFFNGLPDLGFGVLHEFTHLVTLALNPTFNNNPRWLWEATAIYESKRPPVPEISDLNCITNNSAPTLSSLNKHPFNIYKVGFFLVDFIETTWGQDTLIALVKFNGDTQKALGISESDFEQQWLIFLKNKYKLNSTDQYQSDC